MTLKTLRKRRAPAATALVVTYLHALFPMRVAFADETQDRERAVRVSEATHVSEPLRRAVEADGRERVLAEVDAARASVRIATAAGVGVNATAGNTTPPPLPDPAPAPPPIEPAPRPPEGEPIGGSGIALASGAGTTGGLGEGFNANLATGTGSLVVPVPLLKARGGAQPELSLAYSTGGGNGVVGLGWNVGAPYIARETQRGIPDYDDRTEFHPEQDRFTFNGAELVPLGRVQGGRAVGAPLEGMPPWSEGWQYFRSRVEAGFFRFFWSPDHRTWRVQTGQGGGTAEFGVPLDGSADDNALEGDTDGNGTRIFRWNVARTYDAHGDGKPAEDASPKPYNVVVYRYLHDGGLGYLSDIYDTPPVSGGPQAPRTAWAHHTRLIWETRSDVVSNYRRGWLVSQRLRLRDIDLTSKTYTGATQARRQVRRVHLTYDPSSHVSMLASVALEGRCDGDEQSAAVPKEGNDEHLADVTGCASMPAMTFGYGHVRAAKPITTSPGFEPFDGALHDVTGSPPIALDGALGMRLVDVDADGLPDLLDGDSGRNLGGHRVFINGNSGKAASFAAPVAVPIVPVTTARGDRFTGFDLSLKSAHVVPLDYDGDGALDLTILRRFGTPVVYRWQDGRWDASGSAASTAPGPDLELVASRSHTRVADANGDGLVDVIVSTGTEMLTYLSLAAYPQGDGAFGSAVRTGPAASSLTGAPVRACLPANNGVVSFADPRVQIADVNGDGLADITRIRRGLAEYWPGRGDGHWGTGDLRGCQSPLFAAPVVMANAPFPSVPDDELRLGDVNGDGLADLMAVEGTAVVVWLNLDGQGWTAPITIPKGPFVGTSKNTTQVADIDGSATPDIVFGDAGHYRYIDLLGGARPGLLEQINTGFGKTTWIQYSTSTAEELAAATRGAPWHSTSPVVVPVVKRTTTLDNLDRLGLAPGVYTTTVSYADPFYDRRGPSFRGFREATQRTEGGADAPAVNSTTRFNVGECSDEDAPGRCARRDLDNPRDALRGVAMEVSVFDDSGTYLSTTHTTYRLRQLFVGLDGREVRMAHPSATDAYAYDTNAFAPSAQSVSIADVERETLDGRVVAEPGTLTLRAVTGRVHTRTETDVDAMGHVTQGRSRGCVEGCGAPDETLVRDTRYAQVPGDRTGWNYRTTESWVSGSTDLTARHHTIYQYDALGRLTQTAVVLAGSLPLLRGHPSGKPIAPAPPTASRDGTIVLTSQTYDALGHAVDMRGANHQCFSRTYDDAYGELPVLETRLAGPPGGDGCGTRALVGTAAHDRGLQIAVSTQGVNGERARTVRDGFGRLVAEYAPDPDVVGALSPLPSKTYEYVLPSEDRPMIATHTRVLAGTTKSDPTYVDSWSVSDSFGRALAAFTPADRAAGDTGDWIVHGRIATNGRGEIVRAYEPAFWSGDPLSFPFATAPTTAYEQRDYDAFGRVVARRAVDGSVVERSVFRPLSTDHWDAGDLASPGAHAGTYVTTELDGHGRVTGDIERFKENGALVLVQNRVDRLPSGEVSRTTRTRLGSAEAPVVRWMVYDTLGRMVLNAEPDGTPDFTSTPPADVSALRAWRYAYDDSGQLVGTSDGRGCGANYFYDTAGRVVAQDRSPCTDTQPDYSPPDLTSGDGTEVFYRYDVEDPDLASLTPSLEGGPASGGALCPAPLANALGRVTSITTLGSKSLAVVDGRGRAVCGAKRITRPGSPSPTLASRFAPRWYVQHASWDGAGRLASATTGARSPELLGSDGTSTLAAHFTRRGDVGSIDGSYGVLLHSRTLDALGRPLEVTFGDVAHTTTSYGYDGRHRLATVQTTRGRPTLWSGASGNYTPPNGADDPTLQTVLEDGQFAYDEADNPIRIVDNRDPAQWPAGARPVTRAVTYDDLYRVTRVEYTYAAGGDAWQSPYAADLQAMEKGLRPHANPSPHVAFTSRVQEERFAYDWRGNVVASSDDAHGFYDRSLGTEVNGGAGGGPHQLVSASNRSAGGARQGDLAARYDETGNLVDLALHRDGPCLPTQASCSQRFAYEWSEVGELLHARRWDLVGSEHLENGVAGAPLPARAPDAELRYAYTTGRQRVLKSALDAQGAAVHDAYVFDTLEVRHAQFAEDYELTPDTETVYLSIGGTRLGRVQYAAVDAPRVQSGRQHVFLELRDHLGSNTIVLDRDTSELVERSTYTAFGQAESDYRPARWDGFREPYRFTGKEDDTELGLVYIGKRYYAPALHRWISPDPLEIHSPGAADANVYAYVSGRTYVAVDPDGQIAWFIPILIGIAISAAVNIAHQEYNINKAAEAGETLEFDWGSLALSVGVAAASGGAGAGAGALAGMAGASAATASVVSTAASSLAGATLGNAGSQAMRIHHGGNPWSWGEFAGAAAVGTVSGAVGGGATAGLVRAGFSPAAASGFGSFGGGMANSIGSAAVNGTLKQTSIADHFFVGVESGLISYGSFTAIEKAGLFSRGPSRTPGDSTKPGFQKPYIPWGGGNKPQGDAAEAAILEHEGVAGFPGEKSFPVIDGHKTPPEGGPADEIVSAKSVDVTTPRRIANPDAALTKMVNKYANELYQLNPGDRLQRGDYVVDIGEKTKRTLGVAVPSLGVSPTMPQTVFELQEEWQRHGVTVKVFEWGKE